MNHRLVIAYDGTDFHGWQKQPKLRTVQSELCRALEEISGHEVHLVGAGRTDAGVHALGQVASVSLETKIPPKGIKSCLGKVLPPDVEVLQVSAVHPEFHARRDAVARSYEYRMVGRGDLFTRRYAFQVGQSVDFTHVRGQCRTLLGEHDFSSFCCSQEKGARFCRVQHCDLEISTAGTILKITADHFLYNMVRILVGTVLAMAKGRIQGTLQEILEARNRQEAGPTAPPNGLFLTRVDYKKVSK